MTSLKSGQYIRVNDEVHYYTQQIVNVVFIEDQSTGNWVLVDAGMPMGGSKLIDVAKKHFGSRKPSAILLTHGHFDHVGSIKHLIEEWNVPVYAHPEEFPFLTGSQAYPEPDNTVEGGMLAKLSSIYPIEPVDISAVLQPLPPDGSVPFLKDWRWLHVPGHSPGQVAFYHDAEKLLVSGDAIITVRQDAMYKVLLQK
ncbi:MAG: MBL fold metallo-hydrolase, partial [Chitinophagaceae bacterium]